MVVRGAWNCVWGLPLLGVCRQLAQTRSTSTLNALRAKLRKNHRRWTRHHRASVHDKKRLTLTANIASKNNELPNARFLRLKINVSVCYCVLVFLHLRVVVALPRACDLDVIPSFNRAPAPRDEGFKKV